MAKKSAKKKSAKKKSAAKKKVSAKPTSVKAPARESCECNNADDVLCKISLIAAVFFVMSLIPRFGSWVIGVSWWIWLVIAIIIGWKPMMKFMNKK